MSQLPTCRFFTWIAPQTPTWEVPLFPFYRFKTTEAERCSVARPEIHRVTQNSGEVQNSRVLEDTDWAGTEVHQVRGLEPRGSA